MTPTYSGSAIWRYRNSVTIITRERVKRHWHDQASLFERRQKFTRGYQAAVEVTPTQQRLGGDDSAAESGDHRLVMNQELFLLERLNAAVRVVYSI